MDIQNVPRIVQELVPGKQITLAHIIANPDDILYQKLGLNPAVDYAKAAIGILTRSPSETAIIAGDLAIKTAGIACVIAASFARIFYRNAINIGFPILECAQASREIRAGDQVSVDFATGRITDETTGKTYQAAPFPEFVGNIIESGGLLKSLKDRGVAR